MIFPSRNSRNIAKKTRMRPPAGTDSKGTANVPNPLNLQRYLVEARYLFLYLILLMRHGLFAAFHILQGRGQVEGLTQGPQPVRKGLKNYIGGEKVPERCPVSPRSRACRYLRAVSRLLL